MGAPAYGSALATRVAPTSAVATPPVTTIGSRARLSAGEATRQRRISISATAAAVAMPVTRSMLISRRWTSVSSRRNRRLRGHGQPLTCSMPMNISIRTWTTAAFRYPATTTRRSQLRAEPAVREREDEMRENRGRDGSHDQPDRKRQRSIRLDERPREEREARTDHERARPPFTTASRGDEASGDEGDAGNDRKGGQRGAVATKLVPLDRRRGQRRRNDGGGADADRERA